MKKIIPLLLAAALVLACTLTQGTTAQIIPPTLQATTPAQPSTPELSQCTVIAFQALNLRKAPGTSAAVLTVLERGEVLTILPRPAQGNWVYVNAGGREGWVNKNYCETKGN